MIKNKKIDWKVVWKIGGAHAAYQIGAGFATGQESLQYIGSFGGHWPFILPALLFVMWIMINISQYKAGFTQKFQDPNQAYDYYCGSKLGKVINVFSNVTVGLSTLVMFAGAGATVNQYLGLPVYVGTIAVGILSVSIVCLGLKSLSNILCRCGILIIVLIVVTGISSFVLADHSIMEGQKNVMKYVNDGIILQAQAFGVHNPILVIICFMGLGLCLAFTFNIALGEQCKNIETCVASSVCASVFYVGGILMVLFSMLRDLDYIGKTGAKVPMLAVVAHKIPFMELPYTIIIFLGVINTISGYLWVVGRRFAEDKTIKQRLIVILMAVIGCCVGSVIPIDRLLNYVFPIAGYIGIVLFVLLIVKEISLRKGRRE